MPPRRFLICMLSASFVPNLAPLSFLAQLQRKVALIRLTIKSVSNKNFVIIFRNNLTFPIISSMSIVQIVWKRFDKGNLNTVKSRIKKFKKLKPNFNKAWRTENKKKKKHDILGNHFQKHQYCYLKIFKMEFSSHPYQ